MLKGEHVRPGARPAPGAELEIAVFADRPRELIESAREQPGADVSAEHLSLADESHPAEPPGSHVRPLGVCRLICDGCPPIVFFLYATDTLRALALLPSLPPWLDAGYRVVYDPDDLTGKMVPPSGRGESTADPGGRS